MKPPRPKITDAHRIIPKAMTTDLVNLALYIREKYGYVVEIPYHPGLGEKGVVVSHPDDIESVLQSNQSSYQKPDNQPIKDFRYIMGEGLVASEGDLWLRQTRMIQPMFQRRRVKKYIPTFREETIDLFEKWDNPIPLMKSMKQLTIRLMGKSFFSEDVIEHESEIRKALQILREGFKHRRESLIKSPLWLPTPKNRELNKARNMLRRVARQLIRNRLENPDKYDDFLAKLMQMEDSVSGEKMSNTQIQDEVVSFIIAGHETTASALTWTFYLLASNTNELQKSQKEARSVGYPGRNANLLEDYIDELTHIEKVFNESLRLYPPIPMTTREPTEDVNIRGYRIEEGTSIIISPFLQHRDPNFWETPSNFNPNRFDKRNVENQHEFSFIPFSAGGHACTGQEFATLEALTVLQTILEHKNISFYRQPDFNLDSGVNLQPSEEIYLNFNDK